MRENWKTWIKRDKGLRPFGEARRLEVVDWGGVLESELKGVRIDIKELKRSLTRHLDELDNTRREFCR